MTTFLSVHSPARERRVLRKILRTPAGVDPALFRTGTIMALLLVPTLLASAVDPRLLDAHSVWVKPAKFFLSLVLYFWTLAWLVGALSPATRRSLPGRYVTHVTPVLAALEMAWLLGMAAAGVPSHFNRSTPLTAALYSAAGIGAVGLTLGLLAASWLAARDRGTGWAPALRWSVFLGGILAFAGTVFFAGVLGGSGGHAVGGVPGHPGLPLLGWSTTGGDLRVAHFFATHAIQCVPLVGLFAVRMPPRGGMLVVTAAALGYAAFTVFTFVQARQGLPFIGG
jgi:hypothetical protein